MVDYTALRSRVSFYDLIKMLNLPMSAVPKKTAADPVQFRGPCPRCKQGGMRAVAATEGKGFTCYATMYPDGKHRNRRLSRRSGALGRDGRPPQPSPMT